MSGASLGWRVRSLLGPRARRVARDVVDLVGARGTMGSVAGTRTGEPVVSVTFDDGPDPHVTPRVLDALERHGVGATFFVLSDAVRRHPDLVRAVVDAGHEVALHGDDHTRLTTLPLPEVRRRLTDSADVVQQASGVPLRWFRPPFGAQDRAIHGVVHDLGLETVVWGPTAYDWEPGTAEEVAERGLAELEPGAVLLLHDGLVTPDGHEPPPGLDRGEAHAILLERLRARGYDGASVTDLLARGRERRTVWYRP